MKRISQIKAFILLALGLFANSIVFGQSRNPEPSIHDLIQIRADEIYDSLVSIRRDIHQYPELSFEEIRTSKLIEEYLLSLGLEVKTNVGGYGVVGILHGKTKGKIIGWRADMDALETNAPDVVDFSSKAHGVRHICGHDVHTTIGLGIANVLSHLKDSINGTVVFIFQPAEEVLGGAKSMIDDGLFNIMKPDEIYCLHVDEIPAGTVALKSNALFAYLKQISITYKNIEDKDSVESFTRSVLNEHSTLDSKLIWGKRVDHEIGIFSEGSIFKNFVSFVGGFNVHEDGQIITLETAFFGTDKEKLDSLLEKLAGVINKSSFANQFVSITSSEYNKVYDVNNDPILIEKARITISTIYGQNSIRKMYGVVTGFGDDFAYFKQDIPAGYFILGGSNYEKGIISSPHTPDFAVDEICISAGVKYFSSMIVERFKDE